MALKHMNVMYFSFFLEQCGQRARNTCGLEHTGGAPLFLALSAGNKLNHHSYPSQPYLYNVTSSLYMCVTILGDSS